MSGELAEAGGTLKSNPTSKQTTKKKRIAALPAQPPKRAIPKEEYPQVEPEQTAKQTSVSWEDIQSALAATPGLKRIAQYFTIVSFEDRALRLAITDAGRESTNYILAQKQKIEEVASSTAKAKLSLTIDEYSSAEETKVIDAPLDVVEGHTLVQAARGLFNGTVVQVTNNKDKS